VSDIVLVEGSNVLNVSLVPVAPAVANLYGVVKDAATGQPIQGVMVTIAGLVAYTNASGQYAFEGLTPGNYTITFTKDGYETLVR